MKSNGCLTRRKTRNRPAVVTKSVSSRDREARSRRGATMALLVVMLPVVLIVASYCVNTIHMEMTRTELQITTDVATRAAGRTLAVTGDHEMAKSAAERLIALNPVANQQVSMNHLNVVFGVSTRNSELARYKFNAGKNPNAVHVETNGTFKPPTLFPTFGITTNFRPIKTAISTQTELDVALVLDRSGSMAFSDDEVSGNFNPASAASGWSFGDAVPPDARWLDTVSAVHAFLNLLTTSSHDERVTLCTYSDKSKTDALLTIDYPVIESAMAGYSAKFSGGATNIGGGILEGATALSSKSHARPWATRVMIVMSDGKHNTGTDPLFAAAKAVEENIMIYTITFSVEADVAQMQQIAAIGSGSHFHAVTSEQLAQTFQDIARSLPTLITY